MLLGLCLDSLTPRVNGSSKLIVSGRSETIPPPGVGGRTVTYINIIYNRHGACVIQYHSYYHWKNISNFGVALSIKGLRR